MTLKQAESKASPGTVIFKIKDTDIHFFSTLDLKNALNENIISNEDFRKVYRDFLRPFTFGARAAANSSRIKYNYIEQVKIA